MVQGLRLDSRSIQYENLLTHRDREVGRILEFLEVDGEFRLSTNLTKMNPDDLVDIIANYHEVAGILQGTEYESYLD
jgi:hypothetical protein